MATIGDMLLLITTYKEPSHRYPHQVHANLSTRHRELLDSLVIKLNRYSDTKVTLSSLARILILFSIESLNLSEVLEAEDPLCVLEDKSTVSGNIKSLGQMADIINMDPEELVKIDNIKKGDAIWK